MGNPVRALKNVTVDVVGALEELANAIVSAGQSGALKSEIGLIVTMAISFGVFKATNQPAEVDALTAFIVAVAAIGLAATRLVQAFKQPTS